MIANCADGDGNNTHVSAELSACGGMICVQNESDEACSEYKCNVLCITIQCTRVVSFRSGQHDRA